MQRRTSFPVATLVTLVAPASVLLAVLAPAVAVAQPGMRGMAPAGARSVLEVDGIVVPSTRSIEGGSPVATIATGAIGPDAIAEKHVSGIAYDDIVAQVGIGMGKAMADWIANSFKGAAPPRKNGRIVITDFGYKSQSEQLFTDALISAVTIPALDAGSKDAAYFTVQIAPGNVTYKKGGGQEARGSIGGKQKAWLASNFRFELPGLPGNRVSAIDSFTISRKVMQSAVGSARETTRIPGKIEFPNLVLSISMADYAPWADWRDSFLMQGNNNDAAEKSGAIVFLAPDLKEELGRVALDHCGLVRLAPSTSGAGAVARFTVELYCERMGLNFGDVDQ